MLIKGIAKLTINIGLINHGANGVMRHLHLWTTLYAAVLLFSVPSHAATVSFDFAGSGGYLGTSSIGDNGITATGFYNDGSSWTEASLFQRDETNDHGLGVCSEGPFWCYVGGGDVNELSNQWYDEAIRLNKGSNATWVELWVSSLDGGEVGTLYWGDSANVADLLNPSNSFSYQAGVFGAGIVEGNILALAAASGFDATAQYVLFVPGSPITPSALCISTGGCTLPDNDYLVWKGTVNPVPIPAAVWLFGSGLIGLVGIARRKKAA